MRRFAAALLILFLALPAVCRADGDYVNSGMELDIAGYYEPESLSFPASSGGDATFGGTFIGGEAGVRVYSRQRRYGLGFFLGGGTRKATNNANASGTSESLEGQAYDLGIRFYVINLFLGLKLSYSPFDITYSSPTVAKTVTNYKGIGAGFTLGVDLYLGHMLHITPKAEITSIAALPESGTAGSKRLTSYGLGIGLGLSF